MPEPAPSSTAAGGSGGGGGGGPSDRHVSYAGHGGSIARTTTPSSGSQTATQAETPVQPILRLRGANPPGGPRVRWAEDVVDNEGLGRKSSKVCCIYHAPHDVEESSDSSSSSSSSSDSDSDSNSDPQDADRVGKNNRRSGKPRGDRDSGDGRGRRSDGGKKPRRKRIPSPNAYEKMPRYSNPRPEDGGGQSRA